METLKGVPATLTPAQWGSLLFACDEKSMTYDLLRVNNYTNRWSLFIDGLESVHGIQMNDDGTWAAFTWVQV